MKPFATTVARKRPESAAKLSAGGVVRIVAACILGREIVLAEQRIHDITPAFGKNARLGPGAKAWYNGFAIRGGGGSPVDVVVVSGVHGLEIYPRTLRTGMSVVGRSAPLVGTRAGRPVLSTARRRMTPHPAD